MNGNQEHAMWMEIVQRLQAGEMQSEVARAYGMPRGKFRYRLARFLERIGTSEVAATRQSEEGEFEDDSLRDASLVDETWHRTHGLNRIVAMVKEPRTLFVYWEVKEGRKRLIQEHFRADWNDLSFCLLIHDVTDLQFNGSNAHHTIRIDVNPRAESWYIHGVTPGRRYQIDFCTLTITGQPFAILRSNLVETPPLPQQDRREPQLQFGTLHQATPDFLQAMDDELLPTSLSDEPWHDRFTGYNLTEAPTSEEGDKREW